MILGLCLVFSLGGIFLYRMAEQQEEVSRNDQIIRDLNSLKANTQVYVRQLLMLDGQTNDEDSYRQVAEEIVEELYAVNGCYAAACTLDGELLYANRAELFENSEGSDFSRAKQGIAAFTILYPGEEQMAVTFSMPVVVLDETVGILRFWVDYSMLYRQSRETMNILLKTCMAVFCLIFVVAVLLMVGILRPIRRLSRISCQVTEGLQEEQVDSGIFDSLEEWTGSDEVGQPASDMDTMLRLIRDQFGAMREDKLRILELLESRQEFYNNVTHELKTPLTVIQGYSELLETAGEDQELRTKAVTHIRNESNRLYQMVLQLLDMAKRHQVGEKKPIDLNAMVQNLADAMKLRAERYGITFDLDMKPGLVVMGEEERIRPVFVNLFDNAIKYGRQHNPVRVTGQRSPAGAGEGQIQGEPPADGQTTASEQIVVQVISAGYLSEQSQEHIFEPFYRVSKEASREMGSAGLGLPLCRQLMEEQGGTIGVQSDEGTVTFTLCFQKGIPGGK